MKEIYKKKDGQSPTGRRSKTADGKKKRRSYASHKRRRRIIIGVTFIVACVLLVVVMVADNLLNGGDIFGMARVGQQVVGQAPQEQSAASEQGAAEEHNPTTLLGEYFTDYAWDPDEGRQANLKIASKAINNTLLAPGEEFSALDVLAPLDYKPAKVFANGGVDYEIGGGLCQVSSTLFMAANYAGLDIVERNPHYAELPYIRPGLDATVWFGENGWGALDMKFKNNTDGYIKVQEFVNEDGFLIAQIYGEKPSDKVVSMDSEKVEEDLNKGIKWATYKKVTDNNGKVLEDGLLYETVYSYNPPVPADLKHETHEPRGSGWVDASNTTNWNDKDKHS
ncbi:MAG: hypothetical protein QOI57_2611 [Rubrobacteraceae bacterium]|jgi:hypothetical protein|nr:hypothetical protein [Rubrobacteraceae bacterium]